MRCSSYRIENTVRVHYKDRSVNGVELQGNSTGVCREYDSTQYGKIQCFLMMQQVTQTVITGCQIVKHANVTYESKVTVSIDPSSPEMFISPYHCSQCAKEEEGKRRLDGVSRESTRVNNVQIRGRGNIP